MHRAWRGVRAARLLAALAAVALPSAASEVQQGTPAPSAVEAIASVPPDPYPTPRFTSLAPVASDRVENSLFLQAHRAGEAGDPAGALSLLSRAAQAGDERAMTLLAGTLLDAAESAPSALHAARARELLDAAAQRGFSPAIGHLALGRLTRQPGFETGPDAYHLLVWAYRRGEARPAAMLSLMHLRGDPAAPRDTTLARHFAQRAAERGDPIGKAVLGLLVTSGIGAPPDPAQGLAYLQEATAETPLAFMILGMMHEEGLGVPSDRLEAIKAYRAAAEQGLGQARERLDALGAAR